MKIILTTASLKGGGAERVITWLAGALSEHGHEVTLMTLLSPVSDFYSVPQGVKRESGYRGDRTYRNPFKFGRLRYLFVLRQHARSADIVVSFLTAMNAATLIATFGLRTPVVISERNALVPGNFNTRDKLIMKLMAPRGVACLVVQSESIATQFQAEWGLRQAVIPNAHLPLGSITSRQDRQNVVLCVGRLVDQKNHASLLRAWSLISPNHPDWVLRIVGHGPLRETLEELASSLGIFARVEFVEAHREIGNEYARASIFAFPSLYEGFPNALVEAAGSGLPCIATDCPGASSEILEHGKAGILVPVNDDPALAEALQRLISDPDLRRSLSVAAMKSVQRFDEQAIADKWEALLVDATGDELTDSAIQKWVQ